jgi:hypothetical protein
MAVQELQLDAKTAVLSFIVVFGLTKALTNYLAGRRGAALLGLGTAMVYPTLLAAIGDVAHPSWRASSVGVYRLFRGLGYARGALLAGLTADALGLPAAMWLVAGLTLALGVVVAVRMGETLRRGGAGLRHPVGALGSHSARDSSLSCACSTGFPR